MNDSGDHPVPPPPGLSPSTAGYWDHYVNVYEDAPEGYLGSCLRPLGHCELGGCCDVCLYNKQQDHADDAD